MNFIQPQQHARRAFLRRSAQLAMTGVGLPTALNLAALGEAAAFTATDYKALVCVFLYGANDYANTLVTYDNDSYDLYSKIRGGGANRTAGGIALAQSALTPTLLNPTTALAGGRQYALHPSMSGLSGLFNTGKLAVQLNVGPLIVPLTRTQFNSGNNVLYPKPSKLFSHNDQQSMWQSSSPEGATKGWGGNLGDLALANSINSGSLFTCMSVTGNSVYLSGSNALAYQVSTGGPVLTKAIKDNNVYGSPAVSQVIAALSQQTRSHMLENEYNRIMARSVSTGGTLSNALAASTVRTVFPSNGLADQLKMVAKIIATRNALGNKRQVFMVSLGGFDLHDNLLTGHASLLPQVSQAMTAFYNATVELGVADKVTTFTASDFGRTLTSNGDGSDHGWGSHHFVMGGAVRGQAFYGKVPPVSVGNGSAAEDQWHVGQGRLLPSTSVDQYAATLAKWFGVQSNEMVTVLPNLEHFGGVDYPLDLGFMV